MVRFKKSTLLTPLLIMLMAFAACPVSNAQTYTVIQITDNTVFDLNPSLNNNGDIAWERLEGSAWDIYFYDFSEDSTTPVATAGNNGDPALNNNGVIAYQKVYGCPPLPCEMDVFTFDTSTGIETNITNSAIGCGGPQINDNGDIAYIWQGTPGEADTYEVFLYRASTGTSMNVSNNSVWEGHPSVNNNGDVVWHSQGGGFYYQIFLYEAATGNTIQLTSSSPHHYDASINNNGDVAWYAYDVDWMDQILETVHFYDRATGTTTQLTYTTDKSYYITPEQTPLNDNGDLAMTGFSISSQFDRGIYFYDSSTGNIITVRDNPTLSQPKAHSPVINDQGWIAWAENGEIYLAIPENTPTGSNVQVTEGDVTITFDTVTGSGNTTVTESDSGSSPPPDFEVSCTPPVYYDITTTATYTGTIEVCLTYDDAVCDESDLHLFHYEGGTWVDVTTSVDTVANIICGEVTSLSEFLLATYTGPIFVDAHATGRNNGRSWADAYKYLQDGLAVAIRDDEIWVAEGIYKPDQGGGQKPGDRKASFQLIKGVAIYGGFPSGGGTWEQRDPSPNETILSGNIGWKGPTDNSYHVVTGKGTDARTILDGFTISRGNADGSYPDNVGGGMYNFDYSSPTVTNCTFSYNSARGYGGGMYNVNNSSPTLTNCTFSGNSAGEWGGGMYNGDKSSPTVTNCTFSGHSTSKKGGGMYNEKVSPTLTNCTFSGNSANSGGGMHNYMSNPILANCILSGNSDSGGMDESAQIHNDSSTPVINYCCVQGWTGGLGGTGNIKNDPLFVDPPDNLRLSYGSPCIDAGANKAVPAGVTRDIEGELRFVDDPVTTDTGDGTAPIVDMGAHEYSCGGPERPYPPGDINRDCHVDFFDIAIIAAHWLECTAIECD